MQLPHARLHHSAHVLVKHTDRDAAANTFANTPRNTSDHTKGDTTLHPQGHPKSNAHPHVKDWLQPWGIQEPVAYLDAAR